jgi:two-component system response regulator PilR (NtrC family)
LTLPPLRDRREVPLLVDHFLAKCCEQMGKQIFGVSHDAIDLLVARNWPGNIRELENVLERAVALEATPTILADSLPRYPRRRAAARAGRCCRTQASTSKRVKEIERNYIAEALKRAGGVQVKAAELLGMSFRSFRYYAKKYNLR